MLKDIIEKNRKESPETLRTRTGCCKFCGQIASMEMLGDWSDKMCDEAATENCECWEATSYTRKKRQKEKAFKAIEEQFGEKSETQIKKEVKELLLAIINQVVEGNIGSGSLDIGEGLKAKINVTAKGLVKVERTKTEKTSKEA